MPTKKAAETVEAPEASEVVKPDAVIGGGEFQRLSETMGGSAPASATVSPWAGFPSDMPAEIEDFLLNARPEESSNPAEVQMDIMRRILSAKSLDEVFLTTQLQSAEDYFGQAIIITDIRWGKSDFSDGPGVYAIVTGTESIFGNEVTLSCGGINVVAQLYMIRKFDALPMAVEFFPSPRPTKSGYKPLWVKARPDVAVAG